MTLPPVTLLDFLSVATVRRRPAPAQPQQDVDGARRRQEEEQRRAEEEAERRAAEERRRQAVEELRRLEELRLQDEARLEEERRLAEEQAQAEEELRRQEEVRQRKEAERIERLAQERAAWKVFLASVAAELEAAMAQAVGPQSWAELTEAERSAALTPVLAVADEPYEQKRDLERAAQPKKKVTGDALAGRVRARMVAAGTSAINSQAPTFAKIASARIAAREQAAKLAVPVMTSDLTALATDDYPKSDVLQRAVAQGFVELVHNSTYRTVMEKQQKKGQQHAPFSREYSVRIYGTAANPNTYRWCSWLVHVHFSSSANPTAIEYLHIKRKTEKTAKVNHTFTGTLTQLLAPAVAQSVNTGKDAAIGT
ncbi:hypothetical protein V2J56_04395 [Georgenia sp. MJ206]|uniref:hypothetical protein n=1 Tax=Georgenia wangjunii TaxID=3117730 RepID=UPI002F26AB04